MAHAHDNSNVRRIWNVFFILSIITIVEVLLGIFKPEALHLNGWGTSWLNWIFIILTLAKAYGITWTLCIWKVKKRGLEELLSGQQYF